MTGILRIPRRAALAAIAVLVAAASLVSFAEAAYRGLFPVGARARPGWCLGDRLAAAG